MSLKNELEESPYIQEISRRLSLLEQQNRETQMLLRIIAQPVLWSSLKSIFTKPQQLWAYELSDGLKSTRDIGKIVGVDQKTISTWWRTWSEEFHIVEKVGKRGQFKAKYSLLELILLKSFSEATENLS